MELMLSCGAETSGPHCLHIKGVWAHIGYVDHDYLGFLVQRCTFEEQIEKIQLIRQQLELAQNEKIYFRTHRNFIENHEWLVFRQVADESTRSLDEEECFSDASVSDTESLDPFVRLDTVKRSDHKC